SRRDPSLEPGVDRLFRRNLQRPRQLARKRQGRMGEHRRAAEAAPRRTAEAGGDLQALQAVRARDARKSDARAGLGEPGEHLRKCRRGRRGRAAAARRSRPAVRGGRELSATEERRNLQAIAGQDNLSGKVHFLFFNDPATTEISTLSLRDTLLL